MKLNNTFWLVILFLSWPLERADEYQSERTTQEPTNLGLVKQEIRHYFNSGAYLAEVGSVAHQIKEYIRSKMPVAPNDAIVFDIDDTLISTWLENDKNDFGYNTEIADNWSKKDDCPALESMKEVYYYAQNAGLKIVLITGRSESFRATVIKNLAFAGYQGWYGLYLRPAAFNNRSRMRYKRHIRRQLEAQGLHILINVGDQVSDLAGGHAQKTFKLPNPIYFVR